MNATSNTKRMSLSLRMRVILVTIGLQIVFILTFGGIQVYNEYESMRDFVLNSSVTFASCIAHSTASVLSSGDRQMANQALKMARAQHGDDITYLLMQDEGGQVLASTVPEVDGTSLSDPISQVALHSDELIVQDPPTEELPLALYNESVYDVAVPILDHGKRVATLRLGVSSAGIRARVGNVIFRGAWMAALALFAGMLLAIAVDRKMHRSFLELINVTRSIAEGDLEQRVSIDTGDELEELGHTFNDMTEQLAVSRQELHEWGEALEQKVETRTQQLEEERQKLSAIVGGIGAATLLMDNKQNIQWANQVARQWFGPTPNLPGLPCNAPADSSHGRCQGCAASDVIHSGKVRQCDAIFETVDGKRRTFRITASPVLDHEGKVAQVVELIQDVTEERRMEQQLLQASKMVAVGELASAVAHEINNPLAVIAASVERMQRTPLDADPATTRAKYRSYLDAMQRHVYRCKGITEKLLGFGRHREPSWEPTDINRVIHEAIGLVAPRAATDGVTVATDLETNVPVIYSESDGLTQVFVNLLSNAIDACDGDGTIRVTTRSSNESVKAEVSDTGCGIPDDAQGEIFEPFFTTKPEGKGTGLGLPICSRIIKRLGGQIRASSPPGSGAVFIISLPRNPPRGEILA